MTYPKPWKTGAALLLLAFAAACEAPLVTTATPDASSRDGGMQVDGAMQVDADMVIDAHVNPDAWVAPTPTILSVAPLDGATAVPINGSARAVFSEPMDRTTIDGTTFTVTSGTPAVLVPGTVIYAGGAAAFWPEAQLDADTTYTATITTGARSSFGAPLAESYVWSFTTGNTREPGLIVNLGSADDFVMLAKSGISTVPTSAITGNIGVSPAAAAAITGFSLTADATDTFSTSPQVTGMVYASDYEVPTPSNLTAAVSAMELAFTDAAGRAPDLTELGEGNIGGLTIARGVYKWGTGLLIPSDITLRGTDTDVWIFQIAQNLTMSSGARVILAGGARPENVIWQVSGLVDIGTTAHLEGTVLSATSITLRTGATVDGRLFAQTAISIDEATVTQPTP
ncbi:MAG: ice-binding family protein [Myxococcota bacterium]|nr:ice-binding family protein [Myxococcota bacterium]